MSRTYKTDPVIVQGIKGRLVLEEWHTGECETGQDRCDLPPRPKKYDTNHRSKTNCTWTAWGVAPNGRYIQVCGCSLCTEKFYRREDRRRSRHQAKRAIQEQIDDQ